MSVILTTLAADIGGTTCRFGRFMGGELCAECRLASADFSDFGAVLARLFAEPGFAGERYDAVRFAVAGPVGDAGASAHLTNLGWQLDATELAARFALPPITIANDFAAAALGAVTAPGEQLAALQTGEPLPEAPRLVIGAGTGLGMAIVMPTDAHWRVLPGEGGHVGFGPADEEQAALWRALLAIHGRVSWERVLSGPGLAAIHRFISGEQADPGAIGAAGLADPASPAGRAVSLFARLYGSYAGDMALATLPRGGVFLAGGIAAKLLPALQREFMPAFLAKAPHGDLLRRMPVHITLDPLLGLRGASLLAPRQ